MSEYFDEWEAFEREIFTPEEIAESDARVAKMPARIDRNIAIKARFVRGVLRTARPPVVLAVAAKPALHSDVHTTTRKKEYTDDKHHLKGRRVQAN